MKHKLILASKSPRRSQLLEQAGFQFEIRTKEVEEDFPESMPVSEVALFLAEKKADACREFLQNDQEILLTADSTVVVGDKIYNKPENFEHACQMLEALSGKMHTVYTGVCLLSLSKKKVLTGISRVHFETLSREEIEHYVTHFQPFDKAGAYAIQEWIGLCKISKIEGTYSNIMGLPVDLVYRELKNW